MLSRLLDRLALSRWPERVAVALVLVFFTAICLHGIANFWSFGHNGFMGSWFAQAARNTLRFGTMGQAVFHMGLGPPPAVGLYVNHPQLVHWHLVAFTALLGEAEWVVRLTPVLYNLGTIVLLFVTFRRLQGPAVGVAVAAAFSLIPLQMIFANLVSHEAGGVFWSLLFVVSYLRWVDSGRRLHFVVSLAAVTFGVQFDWAAYYFALFVAVHALVRGARRLGRPLRWQPEFSYVGILTAVVLANFYAFYELVVYLRGSFAPLLDAYATRAAAEEGYGARLWDWLWTMEGPLFLALLGIWLAWFVVRAVRRRVGAADWIIVFFLAAQVVHSTVFQNAGYMHSYWLYYLGVAVAGSSAMVLIAVVRWIRRWVDARRWFGAPQAGATRWWTGLRWGLRLATPLVVLGAAAWWQVPRSLDAWTYGFNSGGFASGPQREPYFDQYEEIAWVRHLTTIFNRTNAVFALHWSVFEDKRVEWYYYVDTPSLAARFVPAVTKEMLGARHLVLLIDLARADVDGRQVALVAKGRRVLVHQSRFVAIDLSDESGEVEAWRRIELSSDFFWRWLVNPARPPVRWVREPADVGVPSELLGHRWNRWPATASSSDSS